MVDGSLDVISSHSECMVECSMDNVGKVSNFERSAFKRAQNVASESVLPTGL